MANGQQAKVTLSAELASNYVQSFDKAIARARELQKSLGKLGTAQKKMAQMADRAQKEVRESGQAAQKSSTQVKKYSQSVTQASAGTGKLVKQVAGLAAAYLSVQAAIGFVGDSLRLAGEFSTQIATAGAVSSATAQELSNLTDIAREMGASTEFTASQAAEALTFLGRAGVQAADQVAVLPKVLDLATASGMDLAGSTDILLSTMAQFQKPLSDVTNVMDVMVKTVNTSKNDMVQFAEAMKFLGPTAKALGISLEEASAIIGILGNNGLNGSIATRALGTSLTRILKPTKKMREEMAKYNLEFTKDGQIKGFAEIIDELSTKLAGATDVQKQAALATIFGGEAIQELNILMSAGADTIVDYTGKLANSAGTAKTTAEAIRNVLGGSLKTLKSAYEEVQLAFIAAFGDDMKTSVEIMTQAMRDFGATLKDPEVQAGLSMTLKTLNMIAQVIGFIAKSTARAGGKALGVIVDPIKFASRTVTQGIGSAAEAYKFENLPNVPQSIKAPASVTSEALRASTPNIGKGIGAVSISSPININVNGSTDTNSLAQRVSDALGGRNDDLVSQIKRSTQL